MGGQAYVKGAAFEHRVMEYLISREYYVVRSSKSHGAIDLMCWNGEECLFVQCKTNKHNLSRADRQELINLGVQYKSVPILAYKDPNGHIVTEVLK